MCYYFDDIIRDGNFDFDNILLDTKSDEKSDGNILIYYISYKTFMDVKPLRIRFDKIDGFIKIHDATRYLVLFDSERYDAIYGRIRYLISHKSGITYSIDHNFARILINSYNVLPIEKTLTFLSQFLIRIKITTIMAYSKNKVCMKINLI